MAVAGYRKKDYRRACSICGGAAWFSEMRYVGQNRWACDVDAPGLTAEQISRHNARVRPLRVKPHKHPKQRAEIADYKLSEAMLFSLVRDQWAFRNNVTITGAGTVTTSAVRAGASGMYFAEIIDENERPESWISQARTQLRAIADFIITQQYGSSDGPSPSESSNSVLYGMVQETGAGTQGEITAQTYCGLTLARAYRILGERKYLDAANRAVTFVRQGLQQRQSGVTSVSPEPFYVGGFCSTMSAAKAPSNSYAIAGAGCLWFLAEMKAIVGGSAVYGTASAGGDFTGSAAGSIDTMISEARAFYAENKISGYVNPAGTGAQAPMSMLSTATPRQGYQTSSGYFINNSNGQYLFSGQNFALALRGLFAADGYSSTVASIYEWLMGFTSNPLSQTPPGTSSFTLANTITGDYDPNIALCANLTCADANGAAVAYNFSATPPTASSNYNFASAGLLAPVRVASGRDCKTTKDELSVPRRQRASHTDDGQAVAYPHMRGSMGLSGQMSILTGYASMLTAPLIGSIYRYAPKTYPNLKAG